MAAFCYCGIWHSSGAFAGGHFPYHSSGISSANACSILKSREQLSYACLCAVRFYAYVYWKATKDSQTVSGSAVINIAKAPLTIYSRSSGGGSSSSGSSYTVSVPSAKNGDVTVSPKNASKGDGKYTFTMPGGKVEVKATFAKAGETSPFVDVPTDSYYFDAVKWAQKLGITNGKTDALFGSSDPCTRGQSVTFLYRAMIRRISVDTILNAKKGDESAIQTILNYYKGYMLELCKFELYDASGKIYVCYDEDLYQELQFKLIKEIQNRFELS